jgi:hypothetical protein
MNTEVLFQYSPWFLLLCVLVGVAYAVLMYQKKYSFSRNQRIGLALVRGLLVSTLCFLLLNPLFKREVLRTIPPTVVIALDDSRSMKIGKPDEIISKIGVLSENLTESEVATALRTLTGAESIQQENINQIKFDGSVTNISKLLANLSTEYEGQNLTDVIVVSDGIVNSGISPTFATYPFNIHTVGVGDTTRKKDVRILGIFANQVAYVGNTFPVEVEMNAFGYAGKQTTVLLKRNDIIIDKQIVRFGYDDEVKRISFTTKETQEGVQRYRIEVLPLAGESSTRNNRQDTYIDVIDGKEKILLLALAPHPDVKAIRAILEKNELYELTVKVNSSDNFSDLNNIDFDILILHQFPDKLGRGRQFLPKLLSRNKPTMFILGGQTDILSFNGMQQALGINPQGNKSDQVTATLNTTFKRFNLTPGQTTILNKFPEMIVPFGDFRASVQSDIILWQQVGNVTTKKPLLLVNTNAARKTAVLAGEGIWRWRMEEFDLTENQVIVDDIISKTVQLISVKDDKRKLRVYTTLPTYDLEERVSFENEIYNNIYERVYGQQIDLEITNEKGQKKNFNYTIDETKSSYEVSDLGAGVYRYKAKANVLSKTETAEGQFVITDIALEEQNTTADHSLLRTVSQQNNGKFVKLKDMQSLIDYLKANKSPGKALSSESIDEVISLRWLLVLLLLLATIEWSVRKYLGTY